MYIDPLQVGLGISIFLGRPRSRFWLPIGFGGLISFLLASSGGLSSFLLASSGGLSSFLLASFISLITWMSSPAALPSSSYAILAL
jgi:hypothetical protein